MIWMESIRKRRLSGGRSQGSNGLREGIETTFFTGPHKSGAGNKTTMWYKDMIKYAEGRV
jgi:hypothetical protein